jgi:hypothetical protein
MSFDLSRVYEATSDGTNVTISSYAITSFPASLSSLTLKSTQQFVINGYSLSMYCNHNKSLLWINSYDYSSGPTTPRAIQLDSNGDLTATSTVYAGVYNYLKNEHHTGKGRIFAGSNNAVASFQRMYNPNDLYLSPGYFIAKDVDLTSDLLAPPTSVVVSADFVKPGNTEITVTLSDGQNEVVVPSEDFDTEVDCSILTSRVITPT